MKNCPYCGNHQISHIQHYVLKTTASFPLTGLTGFLSRSAGALEVLAALIYVPMVTVLHAVGAHRWQDDIRYAVTGRSRVIWQEAQRRAIPMQQLVVVGKPLEFYRARIRGKWQHFNSLPIPSREKSAAYHWLDDKLLLKRFYEKNNIPVPRGDIAWNKKEALDIFRRLTKPVIVKPRFGSHGRHSVTNLHTEEEFLKGYKIATKICQCIIVEEHLDGSVYRATYVNGKVVGILRGDPPRVVGDGISSIKDLVLKKNQTRPERVAKFAIDQKCIDFLARKQLSPISILEKGVVIDLSEKIGLSYGGYTAEMISATHPELLRVLKKAGDLLVVGIVGFDFIIKDPTQDPSQQRWGIIEANAEPFIDLHENPLEGEGVNVAAYVWDMWGSE